MRIRALVGAAALLILAGCGPRPSVEIRVMPAPTPEAVIERAMSDSDREAVFVLNPSSGKFHRPSCTWAQRIAEDRRIEYAGDRETLIEVGYQPCHFCKP